MSDTRLIKIRKHNKLTRPKAAESLGVSLKSLYNYECGKPIPSDVLVKMSKLYDCSVDYLLGVVDFTYITVAKKDGEVVVVISKDKVVEHKDFSVIFSTD